MKKYLKMSDLFEGGVTANHGDEYNGWSVVETSCGLSIDESGDGGFEAMTADYVAHAINNHDELVAMNKELLAALEKVVSDITALSENSYGVHGLHKNGDLAPWSSLFSGGFFEGWLLSVDEAGALIAKAKDAS